MEQSIRRYARLLVDRAVNLQPGQLLFIEAALEAENFVCLLAEEALSQGASDVRVRWVSNRLERTRMDAPHCNLSAGAGDKAMTDWLIGTGGAYLRLDSPDTAAFQGVDPGRLREKTAFERAIRTPWRGEGAAQTSIACVPTPAWAAAVFPEAAPEAALEKLWRQVLACCAADQADPEGFWDDNFQKTASRRQWMERRGYTALRLLGPGTDLTVGLPASPRWDGGGKQLGDGPVFIPNLPTYEVFTTPHKYKADGRVRATRPLNYGGGLIRDFWLTFASGQVTDFGAAEGEALLGEIVHFDAGSCRLGEIALVPHSSPVSHQETVFLTTLLDENASCHLALGSGFARGATPAESDAAGYNESGLHVDFMVGSGALQVLGQLPDGRWEKVLENGEWCVAVQ